MFFQQITTPGLGCLSYMLGCPAAGVAAVVDPRRDIDVYLDLARQHGMKITHIFETHVHADHVSGALELAKRSGAQIFIHESADIAYAAEKIKHGDSFELGAAHIKILHTPGHTPNSVSLVAADAARSPEPQMVLTGDLLFVGDIGRPDLPGDEILQEQVQNLYDSLHTVLGDLPDGLEVYPAHGQGSLCGGGLSAKPHSTLGYERRTNPRLRFKDFESFAADILSGLPMRPQSFSHIIAANLEGPSASPVCEEVDFALTVPELVHLAAEGSVILDLRGTPAFAAAHIPGSLHVDAGQSQALNWIGVAVPPKANLVLVLESEADFERRRIELRRIGYDKVLGWLKGGLNAWIAAGRSVSNLPLISADALKIGLDEGKVRLLDVRTEREYDGYKLPGALHLSFEDILAGRYPAGSEAADDVVLCRTGYRAAVASSLLMAAGHSIGGMLAGGLEAFRALNGK